MGEEFLVIFAIIGENRIEFLAPPPPGRGSPKRIKGERAQGGVLQIELQFQLEQKEIFIRATVFADKFVLIQCRLIVFDDCLLADCSDIELLNSGMACSLRSITVIISMFQLCLL